MKSLINSFVVAFSMYSKIPMPRADWTKENMKYSMCFFPWVGLAVGALELDNEYGKRTFHIAGG